MGSLVTGNTNAMLNLISLTRVWRSALEAWGDWRHQERPPGCTGRQGRRGRQAQARKAVSVAHEKGLCPWNVKPPAQAGEKLRRGHRDRAHSAVLAQGPEGPGTEWATCRSAEQSRQVGTEGAQVRTVGSSGATVRGRPLPTAPGGGQPPEISAPDQRSPLGQASRVGLLSLFCSV